MKKVISFCLTLIICVGLIGCNNDKTTLDKLEGFTERQEEKVFVYDKNEMLFMLMYDGRYGNPQVLINDSKAQYIYAPKEDMFVITSEYDTEESVTLYYFVEKQTASLDQEEYKTYDLSGCDSFESCVDEITDEFSKRGYIKKADELLKELNTLLEENDLSFEDIDVPFDELDK